MHTLSDTDRAHIEDVEERIREAGVQLGYCREQYLRREQALLAELTRLRAERTQALNVMARHYLQDQDPTEWQYNADTKTFERR